MFRRPTRRFVLGAATAALGAGLIAVPALADSTPGSATSGAVATARPGSGGRPDPGGDALDARLHRACGRIPTILQRMQTLQTRLAADGSTPGSIASLQQRIDSAKAAGDTDLATALQNRLAVRHDLQSLAASRIALLKQAQDGLCVDVAKVVGG